MRDVLDRSATPDRLEKLAAAGVLVGEGRARAYAIASSTPPAAVWRAVLDRVLLVLGALLVASGVVFFFAYNWAKLAAFAKLGIVACGIVLSVAVAQARTLDRGSGKVALLVAAILVGPLLAVYGQHYQTGADPYELFLTWTILVLPWIAVGRSVLLLLLGIALADVTLSLYCAQASDDDLVALAALGAFHAVLLVGLEIAHATSDEWLRGRWLLRFVCLVGTGAITLGACAWVVKHMPDPSERLCALGAPVAWVATFVAYEQRRRDVVMLAIAGSSIVCVASTVAGNWLLDASHGASPLFALGLLVVAEVAALARWLRWEAHRTVEEVSDA